MGSKALALLLSSWLGARCREPDVLPLNIFIAAAAIILVGATIQGLAGFGMNVLASPLLFLMEPDLVPGPIILAALFHTVLSAWRERGEINFPAVAWIFSGTIPGVVTGALAARILSDTGLALMIAIVILCAVGLMASGFTLPQTKPASTATGLAAGFSSATSAVAGPMAALYLSGLSGPQLRSTLATYFLISGTTTLCTLSLFGEFSARQFAWGLLFMPFVAVGFLASSPLRKVLDKGYVRPAVLIISSGAALTLLVRSLL